MSRCPWTTQRHPTEVQLSTAAVAKRINKAFLYPSIVVKTQTVKYHRHYFDSGRDHSSLKFSSLQFIYVPPNHKKVMSRPFTVHVSEYLLFPVCISTLISKTRCQKKIFLTLKSFRGRCKGELAFKGLKVHSYK